jgi:hypothetical protein
MATDDDGLGQRDDHPSYGMIVLSKVSTSGQAMVGSPLIHRSLVHLEVKGATKRRAYGRDDFYDGPTIVDVYMTENQWAQFVSSFGVGGGTPVTLHRRPAEGYRLVQCGDPPRSSPRGAHAADVEAAMAKAKGAVDQLNAAVKAMQDKPASQIKKADVEALRAAAIQVNNWLTSNLPFVHECFERSMESTLSSAKAEVVGFTTGLLARAGLEHILASAPVLELDDKTETDSD